MAKGKGPSSSGESTPTESTLKRVTGSERQSVMSQKVCIMLTPCDLITDIDCNFKAKETSSEVDLPSTGNANQMGLSETGNQSYKGDAVHLADASILEDEVRSPSNGFSPGNFYGSKKQNMSPRIRIFSPSAQKNLREERSKSLSKHSLGVKRKNKKQRNSSEVRKMQRTSNMARQSESSEGKQRSVATGKKTCGEFADSTKIISKAENHDESKDEPKLCKSEINGVESNFTEEKRFSSQSGCAFEQSSNTSVGAMSSDSSPTLVNVASSNASEVESVGSEVSLYSGPGSVMDGLFLRKNGNEYFFSNLLDSDTQNTEGFASHKFARESIINGVTMLNPSSACDNIEGRTEEPPISCDVADDSQSSFSISLPSPDTSESDFILKLSEKEADSSSTKSSPEHQAPITKYFKSMTGPKCRTKLMTSSVSFSGMSSVENSPEVNTRISPSRRRKVGKRQEQMYLDLGQKDFGHVTCPTCGMVYTKAQPDDEAEHIRHHKRFVSGLRFTGWKNESLIKEYQDGRVIMVGPDDHPLHLKKVEEIRKVVDSELGFVADVPNVQSEAKTFVFITAKKVVGCTVAVQIDQGYPVLPSPGESSTPEKQIAAWCCSTTPTPAQCGISRIWVHSRYRRKKVATRLLDCVRMNFLYGCVIPRELVAFSDPTPDGKRLAQSYTGTSQFLVFR